jgi:hypothetical protein
MTGAAALQRIYVSTGAVTKPDTGIPPVSGFVHDQKN